MVPLFITYTSTNHMEVNELTTSASQYATMPKEQVGKQFYSSWQHKIVPGLRKAGESDAVIEDLDNQARGILRQLGLDEKVFEESGR